MRTRFELDGRVAAGTGHEPVMFPHVGIALAVLQPGKPNSLYHRESGQEDFLVLSGECLAIVEGEERHMQAFDLLHCPPWTNHVLVGAGDGPCVVLMFGARVPDGGIVYPRSEEAATYGASVEQETDSPHEAYAAYGHWQPVRDKPEL